MKALIVWYHFDKNGLVQNADSTSFEGTLEQLQERIKATGEENARNRMSGFGPVVPHQIIVLEQ